MIYEGLSRTSEIEEIKTHGGGEISEVYGGLNETNPIFYKSRTLTGTAPLTFGGLGKPLTDYLISGNTVQSGTPTPDSPIMPQGTGERTENLFDMSDFSLLRIASTAYRYGTSLGVLPQGTYTFSATKSAGAQSIYLTARLDGTYSQTTISSVPFLFTADGNSEYIIRTANSTGTTWEAEKYSDMMLNTGSTPLPYEPYGYKIPITCGGETNNIYIGNYPLNKSGNAADDVRYSTQTLTRRIDPDTLDVLATPTTEQITMPGIPTTAGSNTLTIGTTVQPSAVSITGNIKPTGYGKLLDSQDVEIYDKYSTPIHIHG